ncbi:hypothetical protein HK104_011424 [Borealophlyctis nickersoniae]|nr:hypothetical protein HK104_011424 [Borealophlyctis nickersoniae]
MPSPTGSLFGADSDSEDVKRSSAMDVDDNLPELDVGNVDQKIWLVKVPTFVAEKWSTMEEGVDLGRLRIYNSRSFDSYGNPQMQASLHIPDAEWAEELPKNYKIQFTNATPKNEFVFAENEAGEAVSLVGTVQHEVGASPVIDEDYRRIVSLRTERAKKKDRQVVMVDVEDGKKSNFIAPQNIRRETGFGFSVSFSQCDFAVVIFRGRFVVVLTDCLGVLKSKKPNMEKRERLPRDELLQCIFDAFAEFPQISFKGLVDHLDQPQAWLKEVLQEVAVLVKKGAYAGTWELKPEYKAQAGQPSAEGGPSAPPPVATEVQVTEAMDVDEGGEEGLDEGDEAYEMV